MLDAAAPRQTGRAEPTEWPRCARTSRVTWEMGTPTVILACSSCYQIFQNQMPEVEITSLWEIPSSTRYRAVNAAGTAIHDPCGAQTGVQDSVRRLVQRAGYQIEELALSRERTGVAATAG